MYLNMYTDIYKNGESPVIFFMFSAAARGLPCSSVGVRWQIDTVFRGV
ncbi:hypothetical protein V1477_021217 [Vespula maculifrons]|uniref:Uncharacterized protein n=1 Tax=Vespula maculifrons TaxID=7453 RepID=A0ABD2AGI3_VESMC